MSFIGKTEGIGFEAGSFIAYGDEQIIRVTKQIAESGATSLDDGTKYVKAGTPYPSNDANAIGLVYEDTDVTHGDVPGSVIVGNAVVTESLLPVTLDSDAKTALQALGFTFV